MSGKRVLLVEGKQDKIFFDELIKDCGLAELGIDIEVYHPSELNQTGSGFDGLLKEISEQYSLIEKGEVLRLGLIADADSNFSEHHSKIVEALRSNGFQELEPSGLGEIAKHSNANIAPVGLVIMPNHKDAGALEDFFLATCNSDQQACLTSARSSLAPHICGHNLSVPKLSKATVFTWLAWQEKPTSGYRHMHKRLDANHDWMKDLKFWLQRVFS